jgi:Tol biopolymer transport system component
MLVAELDAKRYRWGDVYLVTTRQGGGGTFNGDGSRIAFLSTPPGRMNNEIYVVDVSGENEERITQSRVNHSQLTWQPVSDPAD